MGGLRSFTDSDGTSWQVWEVVSQRLRLDAPERRRGERRGAPLPGVAPERRYRERRLGLAAVLGGGWLVFRSDGQRRRLAPVPPDWSDAPDGTLERYCRAAIKQR